MKRQRRRLKVCMSPCFHFEPCQNVQNNGLCSRGKKKWLPHEKGPFWCRVYLHSFIYNSDTHTNKLVQENWVLTIWFPQPRIPKVHVVRVGSVCLGFCATIFFLIPSEYELEYVPRNITYCVGVFFYYFPLSSKVLPWNYAKTVPSSLPGGTTHD